MHMLWYEVSPGVTACQNWNVSFGLGERSGRFLVSSPSGGFIPSVTIAPVFPRPGSFSSKRRQLVIIFLRVIVAQLIMITD